MKFSSILLFVFFTGTVSFVTSTITYYPPPSPVQLNVNFIDYLSRHDPVWSWDTGNVTCSTGYTQLNQTIKYESTNCNVVACTSVETCIDESASQCDACSECTSFGLCPLWHNASLPQLYGNVTPYAFNKDWTTYTKGGPLLRNHSSCNSNTNINWALAWEDSAFFGNGLVGGLLRVDDGLLNNTNLSSSYRTLHLDIGRVDIWDRRAPNSTYAVNNIMFDRPRLPVGYILLTTVGNITYGNYIIHLANGTIEGFLNTTEGTVNFLLFAHHDRLAFFLQYNTTGNETPSFGTTDSSSSNDGFTITFIPLPGNSTRHTPPSNYQYNPLPTCTGTLYNNLTNPLLCTQELLAGANYATALSTMPFLSTPGNFLTVFYIANDWPALSSPTTAMNMVTTEQQYILDNGVDGWNTVLAEQQNWWLNTYWPESLISLDDTRIESMYVMQMYKYACATRGDAAGINPDASYASFGTGVAIDLMGPWWLPSGWEAYWYDMNVPVTYFATYPSGRFDIASTLTNFVFSNITQLQYNVQPYSVYNDSYGMGGISAYDLIGNFNVQPGQQLGNFPWLMHNLYEYASYMGNDTMLIDQIYPLLRGAMNVYRHFSFVDANNMIHLPPTASPEYPYPHGPTNDTNYDLMLFSWGTRTLLELAAKYSITNDDLLPYYQFVQTNLTPYPRDPMHGYNVSLGVGFDIPHRHFSHLFAMYPLHLTVWDTEDGGSDTSRTIFMQSLDRWAGLTCSGSSWACPNGFTYDGVISMSALMGSNTGDGDDGDARRQAAVNNITYFITSGLMHASTLYSEGHQPCFESPVGAAASLQEILIQSWGGRIRVFPAVPLSWSNARLYNFAAEGGLRISAVRTNGTTQWIALSTPIYETVSVDGHRSASTMNMADGSRTVRLSLQGFAVPNRNSLATYPSSVVLVPVTNSSDVSLTIPMNTTVIVFPQSSGDNSWIIDMLTGNSSQYHYWGKH